MLNANNNITARIDGNPDYEYMKLELRLIDDEIFIVQYDTGYWTFHQLTEEYVYNQHHKPTKDLAQLILNNYGDVKMAIYAVENHDDNYTREIIKGFTISRH